MRHELNRLPRLLDRLVRTWGDVREGAKTVANAEIDVMVLDEIEVGRSGIATDGDVGDR